MLDTGTTMTGVAPRLLSAVGATPGPSASTQTAAGPASVLLYKISFTIYDPAARPGAALFRGTWAVTNLPVDLPDVDVLFGLDLFREIILTVDGPGQTFSLDF
jgi:hypothetical protein